MTTDGKQIKYMSNDLCSVRNDSPLSLTSIGQYTNQTTSHNILGDEYSKTVRFIFAI